MIIGRAIIASWTLLLLVNFVFAVPYPATGPVRIMESLRPVAAAWPGLPGAGEFLASWWERIQSVLLAGTAALAAVFAGRCLRSLMRVPGTVGLWVDGALGLGMLGLAVFGAGLTGILYGEVTGAAMALMILSGARFAGGIRESARRGGSWPRAAGWAAGIALVLWIQGVLNPDAGIDAWVYHLRIPFYYRLSHKVYFVWHHIHGHVPQVWDVVFSLFPAALAATAAQALSAACALAVFSMMLQCSGSLETKLAALLVISSPLAVNVGTSAYSDLPMMWLGFGAFMLLFHPSADPPPSRRFASGVVLALACSIKYAAFPVLAAQAAWLGAESLSRRRFGWWIPAGAGFVLGFAPWLAWNFLDTGNPLFPFLGRLFPGSLAALPFADRVSADVFARGFNRILCSGWNGFVKSPAFLFLSPFFLAVLPVLLRPLRRRIDPPGARLWLGVYFVTWGLTIADERFVLAAVPVFALAVLSQKPNLPWKTVFALFFALNAAAVARGQFVTPRWNDLSRLWASVGIERHRDYFAKTMDPSPGYSEAAAWINGETGGAERVLLVADYKSHLIRRECIHDHVFDSPTRLLYILGNTPDDPARIAARFRQLGIRWVLYLPSRCGTLLEETPDRFSFTLETARAWNGFWTTRAVPRAGFPGAAVYEIGRRPRRASAIADLPGIQDVIRKLVRETGAREGNAAAEEMISRCVSAYPLIGSLHGMLGVAMMRRSNDPSVLAEARRHLDFALRAGRVQP